MKPYIENNKGHQWIEEKGNVATFAIESGTCYGPKCKNCGYEFCHHCYTLPTRECTAKDIVISDELKETVQFQAGDLVTGYSYPGYHKVINPNIKKDYYGNSLIYVEIEMILSKRLKKYRMNRTVQQNLLRRADKSEITEKIDKNLKQLTTARKAIMMLEQEI